ncbi:MAG: ThiF family adenylyltransferase, partial [Streptosporangiaceae bacterium]
MGLPAVLDRGISLWSLAPVGQPTGPADLGPVAVGSTWLVGAGAVGSCLAWWLQFTGVNGAWTVIDGDKADDTNLNRSLGLFAADAGLDGHETAMKAHAAAALIPGAVPYPHWWDDWAATDPAPPDVLIPAANEYGVRSAVAAYGHPATIHATTSRDWTAELHRHLPGRDGCIACRLPENAPAFACATATAPSAGPDPDPGRDAALPFLSAAAGILLLSGLLQLQYGHWTVHDRNHWRVWFDEAPRPVQSSLWTCSQACTAT